MEAIFFKNLRNMMWIPSASASFFFATFHYWMRWWLPVTITLSALFFLAVSAAVTEFESWSFKKKARGDGKDTCLITGGTKGIGFALAKLFARDHYNLIIVARHDEDLQEAKQKLLKINPMISVTLISKDLYKEKAADELFEEVNTLSTAQSLRVNHIINNIGMCIRGDFLDLPLLDQLGMMQLNMVNAVKLTYLFGNKFKDHINNNPESTEEFRFMMTASFASLIVCPFLSVYSGTKAFLHSFAISFNEELKAPKYKGRITCTSLCPGYTLTPSLPPAGIQHTTALALKNYDNADRVGYGGYRAMMQGKPYVLIGFLNNLAYWLTCTVLPISWTAKLGKFFNSDWEDITPTKVAQEGLQAKRGWSDVNNPASTDMRAALANQ